MSLFDRQVALYSVKRLTSFLDKSDSDSGSAPIYITHDAICYSHEEVLTLPLLLHTMSNPKLTDFKVLVFDVYGTLAVSPKPIAIPVSLHVLIGLGNRHF